MRPGLSYHVIKDLVDLDGNDTDQVFLQTCSSMLISSWNALLELSKGVLWLESFHVKLNKDNFYLRQLAESDVLGSRGLLNFNSDRLMMCWINDRSWSPRESLLQADNGYMNQSSAKRGTRSCEANQRAEGSRTLQFTSQG